MQQAVEALCPGCSRNATIAAWLFTENVAKAQGVQGGPDPVAAKPSVADGSQSPPAPTAGQLRPPRPQIDRKLIYKTPPTWWRKAWSYATAKFGGRASRRLVALRREACLECDRIVQKGDGLFCGACGCGYRRDANLAVKTRMKLAACPLGRWPGRSSWSGRLRTRLTGLLNRLRARFR